MTAILARKSAISHDPRNPAVLYGSGAERTYPGNRARSLLPGQGGGDSMRRSSVGRNEPVTGLAPGATLQLLDVLRVVHDVHFAVTVRTKRNGVLGAIGASVSKPDDVMGL